MEDINCIAKEICEARMSVHEERFQRDKERLDKNEIKIETVSDATIKLTQLLAIYSEDLKEHGSRITQIEHRPGNLWDKIVGGFISAIVGGLAAALVAVILK